MVKKATGGWGTPTPTTLPKGKKIASGSGWGSGVDPSAKPKTPKQQTPRDPTTELVRKLAQLQAVQANKNLPGMVREGASKQILDVVKGYKPKDITALGEAANLDPKTVNQLITTGKLRKSFDEGGFANTPVGRGVSDTLGQALFVANAPYRTVTGALGEWSRQGENNPKNVGGVSVRLLPTDLGKIAEAAVGGFEGKTNDSPLTIAQEAGRIRQKQGAGTKAFGVLPGTNLKKGEPLPYLGKPGGIAYDVAASIPVDPLSWVTFGLSAEGRAGMRAAERALGSERALDIAKGGVRVLDAEEKARLGSNTLKLLRNTGGIGVRVPQPLKALREGKPLLSPGKTIVRTRGITEPLGRAASATGHALEGVPVVGAPVRGVKAAYRGLERTFVPRAAILQAERDGVLPRGTAASFDELRVKAMGYTHMTEADLNGFAFGRKAAGLTEGENRALTTALETGSKVGLDERLSAAYDYIDKYRKDIGPELRARGLIPSEADASISDNTFVHHQAASPEAAAYLGAQNRDLAMSPTVGPPTDVTQAPGRYTRSRKIPGTVEDINAQLGHNVTEGKLPGKVFQEDPFIAMAGHSVQARHDIATHDFLSGVMDLTDGSGTPLMRNIDSLPSDFPRDISGRVSLPEGLTTIEVPRQGTFVVDKAIAPEVTKVARLTSSSEEINNFLKGLDKWMNLWKGYATVPIPFGLGFHMRNATSNVMLNWLADISPTDPAYTEAFSIQRKLEKGFKEGDPYKYLSGRSKEIAQQALEHDILKSGFLTGTQDVSKDLMRPFKSTAEKTAENLNPLSTDNLMIRSGRVLGSGIEENARLAHFIAKLRDFKNPEDAAASVRKYLFDYNDLTAVEQNVFKRFIPFYTFTRKNSPLWIQAMIKQPGKYSRVAQWFNAANTANPLPGPLASYMTEGGAANTGIGGSTPWIATPDTPMGAAFKNTVNPAAQLLGVTSGGPEEAFNQLSQNFGGGAPGFAKALYDAYVQKKDPFSGKPLTDPKTQRDFVAGELFPLLGKIEGLTNNAKRKRRLLSMLTGIQATPYDQNTKNAAAWEKLDALIQYLASLRKQGVDVGPLPGSNPNSKTKATAGFGGASSSNRGW